MHCGYFGQVANLIKILIFEQVVKMMIENFSSDLDDPRTANDITQKCLVDLEFDPRREWNLKNALLYGFGILTTLGKDT